MKGCVVKTAGLLALPLCVLLTACTQQPLPDVTEPIATDSLTGSQWSLVEIQSMDDSVYRPSGPEAFTLSFLDNGKLDLRADCNSGRGEWRHEPPAGLRFSRVAVTEIYCGAESIDRRFLSDLSFVRSYVMKGGDLYLATLADGSILHFTPFVASPVEPSFDCAKADSSVQTLVCRDSELLALDSRLDTLYRKALATFPNRDVMALKAYQRGWIKGRDECWKADNMRECTLAEYRYRITELEIKTGAVEVPAPVQYQCDDGSRLSAFFYNNTLLPALVLNDNGEQMLLYQDRSGSGARYTGPNLSFWDKGSEARFSRMDDETSCHLQ